MRCYYRTKSITFGYYKTDVRIVWVKYKSPCFVVTYGEHVRSKYIPIQIRNDFKTRLPLTGGSIWFWAVSIVINNYNCLEQDANAGQLLVEFWSSPLKILTSNSECKSFFEYTSESCNFMLLLCRLHITNKKSLFHTKICLNRNLFWICIFIFDQIPLFLN